VPPLELHDRSGIYQELYVDPHSGLIRVNEYYRSWRQKVAERRQREQADTASRRRMVDARTLLLLIDDVWFLVGLDVLPEANFIQKFVDGKPYRYALAEKRYDIVLRKPISRAMYDELRQCKYLYGSDDVYAASKRQISSREIKQHGLR
jgi:hypothetical protein